MHAQTIRRRICFTSSGAFEGVAAPAASASAKLRAPNRELKIGSRENIFVKLNRLPAMPVRISRLVIEVDDPKRRVS